MECKWTWPRGRSISPGFLNGQHKKLKLVKFSEDQISKVSFLCIPIKIKELVEGLTEAQKRDVTEMGFGGLLQLNLSNVPYELTRYVIHNFDCDILIQQLEKNVRYQVSANDVHDIVGLSFKGMDCKAFKQYKLKTPEAIADDLRMEGWRNNFRAILTPRNVIKLKEILDVIRSESVQGGGINFKSLFVLYVFGFLLDPTASQIVDFKLLSVVENVEDIPLQNWCSFVVTWLGKVVKRLKVSMEHSKPQGTVGSCVLVLVLAYVHRCSLFGVHQRSSIPLIQHWDDSKLKARVEGEKPRFGQLMLDDKTYPITREEVEAVPSKPSVIPKSSEPWSSSGTCGFIKYDIPEGVKTDAEIISSTDDDVKRIWAFLKRDVEVLTHASMAHFKEFYSANEAVEQAIRLTQSEDSQTCVSQTQKWFKDPSVQEIIDKLTRQYAFNLSLKMVPCGGNFDIGFGDPFAKEKFDEDVPLNFFDEDSDNDDREKNAEETETNIDKLKEKAVEAADVTYVSDFMKNQKNLLPFMDKVSKQVVDYIMFKDPEPHPIRY